MKLKFKIQDYQTKAVDAVVDCFMGQPLLKSFEYSIDPGQVKSQRTYTVNVNTAGFGNAELRLNEAQLLNNVRDVQKRQNLPLSTQLVSSEISPVNFDIEMETGTGKTYCYIKSIFELNKRYGWSKFIIVVPSIAIREGIYKSLQITADHFLESYQQRAKFFIYNSKQLHHLESFSSDAGINVMIINVQAFNATGKDNRRIYEELDDFQSRRPIDVIKANRPILILDEPQKMEGKKTLKSLKAFNALMILRYSATHKTTHNKIHRLDALDAYNQKLVKKIAVRGITVRGLQGASAYLYLDAIEISKKSPVARIEIEIKQNNGIKRILRKLSTSDNLYTLSGGLEQYKEGFIVSEINAVTDTVSFTNGLEITAGEAHGDVHEMALRRIQIRETIRAHLQKEQALFSKGIKVLSLFFIDEVAKYRDYSASEGKGEYANIFEEEYSKCINELGLLMQPDYQEYLNQIAPDTTHNGYFSIDKKSRQWVDPKVSRSGETDDVDAYDLILKDKERLLSFQEPIRFIFSHSALREGWDNPNIFVICTLKHSDNNISRRQEVGRGLRISVDQFGERQDNPVSVHNTNVLTIVANESYKDFVSALQKDIKDSLSERPTKANEQYFIGKVIETDQGPVELDELQARAITFYLIQNQYVDHTYQITDTFHQAITEQNICPLPDDIKPYQAQILHLIEGVFSDIKLLSIENDRAIKHNYLNDNFKKKEFQELWKRINQKAVYSVRFDSTELISKCVDHINEKLRVKPLQYTIQIGEQKSRLDYEQMNSTDGFKVTETVTEKNHAFRHSAIKYDLIGKVTESTQLTRKTVSQILSNIEKLVFSQFKTNPESFISEFIRLINEQKASCVIEHLSYDTLAEHHDIDIFTSAQANQNIKNAGDRLYKHIYDYVITDSQTERRFAEKLETSREVIVYAKLPKGFAIPIPVGNYNPDWAITFQEDSVKHVYFIAETKGTMATLELREIESRKIQCAKKFFYTLNEKNGSNIVYDMIDSYEKLIDLVV